MKLRILLLLGWTAWLAPAQEMSCHPLGGDRIQVRDLAAVLPEFLAAPQKTLLAQAPLPGSQRIFHDQELRALAHRFGITLEAAPDTCFEWELQPLDHAAALDAMQAALQLPDARIDIAEAIAARVPAGRIEFPLVNLGKPSSPNAPVLWRGDIVYGEDRKFPIWVRVTIAAQCRKIVAAESLKAGQPVEPRQLRESTVSCFPAGREISPAAAIAGMVALRPIAAGSEVRPEYLAPPNDVSRGDAVHIEVRSGAARLAFTGRALSGGRSGDIILVSNPESNKNFQARITGKGVAVVDASPKGI